MSSRAIKIFNKFFSGFLRDVKEIHEEVRGLVKSTYQVVDKSSDEYYLFFKDNVMSQKSAMLGRNFESDDLLAMLVCQKMSFGEIIKYCDASQRNMVLNYIFVMMLFAYVSDLEENQDIVLDQAVKMLSLVQKGDIESFDNERDDVMDDDLGVILDAIKEYGGKTRVEAEKASVEASSHDGNFDPMGFFDKLNNSKIADLAKEISKDIDVSNLKAENPDDILKNLFNPAGDGNGNVLGNIIQKVSSTLNDKISNGELRHEDLLGEAMSMMSLFGKKGGADAFGNLASTPLFGEIAKAMKGGKANIRQDVIRKASTRDRLKKKLEERRQSSGNQ